ncbi:lyase [Sphingobium yanoikuyae]|jgi:hypothetical protein|uniref:lyase n=1 Tax=Sphingobium yanoikuyae TaxID=13690 RepID=UPI002FDCC6BB
MGKNYEPASDFLKDIIAEEIPLSETGFGAINLRRLIAFTQDENATNQDWATLLLAQTALDTPDVRTALLRAFDDEDIYVSAEALLGVAERDRHLALPLARQALQRDFAPMAVFEAVTIIADASLTDLMRPWVEPSGQDWLDDCAQTALNACIGKGDIVN